MRCREVALSLRIELRSATSPRRDPSMSQRKPKGTRWQDWTTSLIRKAEEEGAFDNLKGKGKPISGISKPYDPMWWAKNLVEREKVDALPETLKLRRDVEKALEAIWNISDEETVREEIRSLNQRIRKVNSTSITGPPSNVAPFDVEKLVARWEERRGNS